MIKLIMMLAVLVSCGKYQAEEKSFSEVQFEKQEEALKAPVFKTNIKTVNFSTTNKKKVHKAADLIQRVVNSPEFKEAILDGRFTYTKGLSNYEIYQAIMRGSEKLSPRKDHEMDLVVETFYADAVTIGYTMTNSSKIFMNRKFLHRYNPSEVTTNLMHEWLHKIGFAHEEEDSPARRASVPYSVGYIVRRLAKDLK